MASNARDKDTARPRFFKEAVQNMSASEKEGRPIYEEKEFVKVVIPGDKLFNFVSEVEEHHKRRWSDEYAAFKRGEERAASGTPLEHWPNPSLNKARVAELKAQNIMSVEELSKIPDNVLGKIGMGARELREQAISYIDAAKGNAQNSAMAAELAQLREMVERLTGKAPEAPKEKTLEDCTDAELKEFIKRETGEAPRGNISRQSLLDRSAQIATAKSEAA